MTNHLRAWVRFSLWTHDTCAKRVNNAVQCKSRRVLPGFSPGIRFPPTENVDRVGWDKPHVDFFYRIAVLLDHEEKESHRLDQVELRPS